MHQNGHYSKGDGWQTDNDMGFYCGKVRSAMLQEIEEAKLFGESKLACRIKS